MVESGWKIVCEYYQNDKNFEKWIPYSIMNVDEAFTNKKNSKFEGKYGTTDFKLYSVNDNGFLFFFIYLFYFFVFIYSFYFVLFQVKYKIFNFFFL
jgi:hypothetical protein